MKDLSVVFIAGFEGVSVEVSAGYHDDDVPTIIAALSAAESKVKRRCVVLRDVGQEQDGV